MTDAAPHVCRVCGKHSGVHPDLCFDHDPEFGAKQVGGVPGEWLGQPMAHSLIAGPLRLDRYSDREHGERKDWWVVSVRLETMLNEYDFVKCFPIAVAPADNIDRMTRDWIASLASLVEK